MEGMEKEGRMEGVEKKVRGAWRVPRNSNII